MVKGNNINFGNRNNGPPRNSMNNNMAVMSGNRQYGGINRNYQSRNNQNNRAFYNRPPHKPFIPHVCFDFVQCENAFQRVKPEKSGEEKTLNEALIKRNQDLTPTSNEQSHLLNLLTKVQSVLDNIQLSPGDFDACQIDEIRQVGSFKKGTMLMLNKLVADLCVVLKTLPTREAVSRLANKVFEELRKGIANVLELNGLQLALNEKGFEVVSSASMGVSAVDVAVQVLVTTQQHNLRRLDPSIHLEYRTCSLSLSSVKHARWFEENASQSTIKVLIRILKDLKTRFEGLAPLNPWIIDLLAHHAIMNNPKREPLSLVVAFKRVLQLISSGFFLPGSAGIIDPCEAHPPQRVHTALTLEQQDQICYTCQTLLRILAHGGFDQIVGIEDNSSIATSPSVWGDVVVLPSNKCYETPKEIEENGEDTDINETNEDGLQQSI